MGNCYNNLGSSSRCVNKLQECKYKTCTNSCNKRPEDCRALECELKELMEVLTTLEIESNKKIDKAREYQNQAEILIAKALEAQCKAGELLEDAEYIESESQELRKKIYNMIYRTIECYKSDSNNCNCNCNHNCCNCNHNCCD
ncbi:MAG: hypothetical protein ACRC41_06140 [Sarcina sp.]